MVYFPPLARAEISSTASAMRPPYYGARYLDMKTSLWLNVEPERFRYVDNDSADLQPDGSDMSSTIPERSRYVDNDSADLQSVPTK